uniref:Uncharacterized protein n=1 Tax=Geospiza parvula TaxID=87175 RepID=A0A8U8BEA8_GEOPR
MECNAVVQEGLWHSNARFTASMSRIMEEYSHPFKDDILVSTDTLTCDTPDRPKQWERSLHEPASGLTDRSSQPSGSSPRMQASYWFRVWGHTDKPTTCLNLGDLNGLKQVLETINEAACLRQHV